MTGYPSGQDGNILSACGLAAVSRKKNLPENYIVESFIDQDGGILTKLFDACL